MYNILFLPVFDWDFVISYSFWPRNISAIIQYHWVRKYTFHLDIKQESEKANTIFKGLIFVLILLEVHSYTCWQGHHFIKVSFSCPYKYSIGPQLSSYWAWRGYFNLDHFSICTGNTPSPRKTTIMLYRIYGLKWYHRLLIYYGLWNVTLNNSTN